VTPPDQSPPEVELRHCKAITKSGQPCKAKPAAGSDYCAFHDPAWAAEIAQARKRGGYNRRTPKSTEGTGPERLRTPEDVQALLEEVLENTRLQENSAQRSRTLISLGLAALKALEVGELEERLEALEVAYKERMHT